MTAEGADVQTIYEQLFEFDEQKRSRPKVFSKLDRVTMVLAVGFFCLAIPCAILARFNALDSGKLFEVFAVVFVLLTQLSALTSIISGLLPGIKVAKGLVTKPVRTFLVPSIAKTQRDYEFAATRLNHKEELLKFVAERLRSEAEHCRSRFGMFFGAVDRTGLFPLLITTGATLLKLWHDAAIPLSALFLFVPVVILLHFLGIHVFAMTHRLEELAEIVDCSVEIKSKEPQLPINSTSLAQIA